MSKEKGIRSLFLDAVSPLEGWSHFFGFAFCQRLWALTKRQDDIVVTDMVVNMEMDMVANLVVDMVADMVANMEVDTILTRFHNFNELSQFWQDFTISMFKLN